MTPDITLTRYAYTPWGTYGRIVLSTGKVLWTAERPWLENRPNLSCIPEGLYAVSPRPFYRGGYSAAEIRDVPGRSYILFHKGNKPDDVEGCIVTGTHLGSGPRTLGHVLNSEDAHHLLLVELGRFWSSKERDLDHEGRAVAWLLIDHDFELSVGVCPPWEYG